MGSPEFVQDSQNFNQKMLYHVNNNRANRRFGESLLIIIFPNGILFKCAIDNTT